MLTPLFVIILSLIFKLTKLHGVLFNDLYEATQILLSIILIIVIGAGVCTGVYFIGYIGA
jgi:hypothetical protein